jgi:hypothetical protein
MTKFRRCSEVLGLTHKNLSGGFPPLRRPQSRFKTVLRGPKKSWRPRPQTPPSRPILPYRCNIASIFPKSTAFKKFPPKSSTVPIYPV